AADQALSEAEQVQLVFMPGVSTAESVTELAGRGVGMDVVRTEIQALGGRLELTSARGRGTTFTIYLPLTLAVTQTVMVRAGATVLADGSIVLIVNPVQLAHRAQGPMKSTATPELSGKATRAAPLVMVVDDSLTVRKITGRLLEREGYRVLTAKDGLDALEQLKGELPAIMLVDIEMPRMDGFDLARNVRGDPRTMEIPIIIISSRTAPK